MDKTLGLVGVGQIGSRVAKIAAGFGMKVVAYDPFLKTFPPAVAPSSLEELLSLADVISLHLPLSPKTEKIIDARALERI